MAVYMVSQAQAKQLRPKMTAGLILVAGIIVVMLGQLVLNMILTPGCIPPALAEA